MIVMTVLVPVRLPSMCVSVLTHRVARVFLLFYLGYTCDVSMSGPRLMYQLMNISDWAVSRRQMCI